MEAPERYSQYLGHGAEMLESREFGCISCVLRNNLG